MIRKTGYRSEYYDGLRDLWSDTFGDTPRYVDEFYKSFGDEITGYVAVDDHERVCAALTCYRCGVYEEKPVYVSYAVCTRPENRGQGLASALVEYVRDEVLAWGGISVVSPAEPSLEAFYEKLGYEACFFAPRITLLAIDDDDELEDFDEYDLDIGEEGLEPLRPAMDLKSVDRHVYNRYREACLSGRPHIELSETMLRCIEKESMGERGLCVVNGGDAICAISSAGAGRLVLTELILNPVLEELSLEIDSEIAIALAKQLGAYEVEYTMPGETGVQSMAAGIPPRIEDEPAPYFGFPIE